MGLQLLEALVVELDDVEDVVVRHDRFQGGAVTVQQVVHAGPLPEVLKEISKDPANVVRNQSQSREEERRLGSRR